MDKIIVPEFLLEMSKQMHEQHNRCTAEPIWQVRCKRVRPTDRSYSDTFHVIDRDNDCSLVADSLLGDINQQIIDYLELDNDDLPICLETWVDNRCENISSGQDKIDYFIENFDSDYDELEGFETVWVEEYEDIIKCCLTESDAEWFIARKQHDYPKLYTYVESMVFCPQMIELRNWILSLTSKGDE